MGAGVVGEGVCGRVAVVAVGDDFDAGVSFFLLVGGEQPAFLVKQGVLVYRGRGIFLWVVDDGEPEVGAIMDLCIWA